MISFTIVPPWLYIHNCHAVVSSLQRKTFCVGVVRIFPFLGVRHQRTLKCVKMSSIPPFVPASNCFMYYWDTTQCTIVNQTLFKLDSKSLKFNTFIKGLKQKIYWILASGFWRSRDLRRAQRTIWWRPDKPPAPDSWSPSWWSSLRWSHCNRSLQFFPFWSGGGSLWIF